MKSLATEAEQRCLQKNKLNTIFLTHEETDRIRKTFKERLKKCEELKVQPRVSSDAKFQMNQVATVSLLADLAGAPETGLNEQKCPDVMFTFLVGRPYPPCTVPLQDLQPMKISDLRMDTHHRGRVLTVRRLTPVVKLILCSWIVVQDAKDAITGEMERLEVSLHKSRHGQDVLESGYWFQIKEPFFTLSELGRIYTSDRPSVGPSLQGWVSR